MKAPPPIISEELECNYVSLNFGPSLTLSYNINNSAQLSWKHDYPAPDSGGGGWYNDNIS